MAFLLKNIAKYATRHTFVFVMFLLCQIVSVLALLFSVGIFYNYSRLKQEAEVESKFLEIYFTAPEAFGRVKGAFSALSSEEYKPIQDMFVSVSGGGRMLPLNIEYDELRNTVIYRREIWERNPNDKDYNLLAGRYMSFDEYMSGQKLVLISSDLVTDTTLEESLGKTIELFGEPYEIIGIEKWGGQSAWISYYAIPDDAQAVFVGITYRTLPTTAQYNALKDTFFSVFGDNVAFPEFELADVEEQRFRSTVIASSLIVALLTAINLAILFRYLLDTRRKSLAVFRLCGGTVGNARRLYIGEVMLFSAPLFILCAVCYNFFILPGLATAFPYISAVYTMTSYATMFVVYSGVIYLVLNTMICAYIRKTPVRLLKEGRGL